MAVAVSNTFTELAHELLDDGVAEAQAMQLGTSALGKRLAATTIADGKSLHVLLQIEIEELEDQVELVAVGMNDVEEAHNVGVAHLLEERNFANGGGGNAFIFSLETDLFECDNPAAVGKIARLVDNTVSTCRSRRNACQ